MSPGCSSASLQCTKYFSAAYDLQPPIFPSHKLVLFLGGNFVLLKIMLAQPPKNLSKIGQVQPSCWLRPVSLLSPRNPNTNTEINHPVGQLTCLQKTLRPPNFLLLLLGTKIEIVILQLAPLICLIFVHINV